ncbi:MAG: HAD-IA family hydrolase [Pseudomonadota bacterium]
MKAILFGSIGSVVETSEMQRAAFNKAFNDHDLPWIWERDDYVDMLQASGGAMRVARYAQGQGTEVDAQAIHATKTRHFQEALKTGKLSARKGVKDTCHVANSQGLQLGFISTTSRASLLLTLNNLNDLNPDQFDLITADDCGVASKPDPAIYHYALQELGVDARDAIAIEDNPAGVESALGAGIKVIAFPGVNTKHLDYSSADHLVEKDVYATLLVALSSAGEDKG